jgi:hypothetical protein
MKVILSTVFSILFIYTSAQRCGTENYISNHPLNKNAVLRAASATNGSRDTLNDEVIVIPVVVHVLYNDNNENISDEQVKSQIAALNKDYRRLNADTINTPLPFKSVAADTRIQFCLVKVDPNGKYSSGIIHKYTKVVQFNSDDAMKFSAQGGDDAWDSKRYLNLWVCNLSGRTLGYAVLPGSPAEKDGVVIKYSAFGTTGNVAAPYNKGRTATHEIGHWLGLLHLWGDAQCGDDKIADTPPQETNNSYCPVFPHTSACSINPYGDMFMDFMDFTDDGCMNMFTQGQKAEMRSLFAKGNARNSLLTSIVCDSANAEGAPLPKPSPSVLKINIYPNPFNQTIHVNMNSDTSLVGNVLRLYNADGKLVLTQIIQSQNTTLNLGNLPAGFYILKIQDDKNSHVYKLIKQQTN